MTLQRQSRQLGNSKLHFSSEYRDHSYDGSAMWPESSSKYRRDNSCLLHSRERGTDIDQGLDGEITSPTLFAPVLMCSQQDFQRLLNVVRDFDESSYGYYLRYAPERKSVYGNEWVKFLMHVGCLLYAPKYIPCDIYLDNSFILGKTHSSKYHLPVVCSKKRILLFSHSQIFKVRCTVLVENKIET